MVGAQRCHTLAAPAIAVAREQLAAVQNARNEIVIGDAHQQPDSSDDVGRGAIALAASSSRQTNLGVHAAHPMNDENDLGRVVVDIGDDLLDDSPHDALFEPRVGGSGRTRWPPEARPLLSTAQAIRASPKAYRG
jgi:hypothetical protein